MRLYRKLGYKVIKEYVDSNKVVMVKDLTAGGKGGREGAEL